MAFIAKPTGLLKQYVASLGERMDSGSFLVGQMAMALEIITQIKCLEDLKVMSDTAKAEAVTALETLLTDCGIHDSAYEMYDKLNEWRRLKFTPAHPLLRHDDEQPSLERARIAHAVVSAAHAPRSQPQSRGPSSEHVSPGESIPQTDRPESLPPERRDLGGGELASPEIVEELYGSAE